MLDKLFMLAITALATIVNTWYARKQEDIRYAIIAWICLACFAVNGFKLYLYLAVK